MRTEKSYVLDLADVECGENREVYSTRRMKMMTDELTDE